MTQKSTKNHGQGWSKEDKLRLLELFQHSFSPLAIATELGRTKKSIYFQLKNVGMIDVSFEEWTETPYPTVLEVKKENNAPLHDVHLKTHDKANKITDEDRGEKNLNSNYHPIYLSPNELSLEALYHEGLISVRVMNALTKKGIKDIRTLFDLRPRQIMRIQNLGRRSLKEIQILRDEHFYKSSQNNASLPSPTITRHKLEFRLIQSEQELSEISQDYSTQVQNSIIIDKDFKHLKRRLRDAKKNIRSLEITMHHAEYGFDLDNGNQKQHWDNNGETAVILLNLMSQVISSCASDERSSFILNAKLGLIKGEPPLTFQSLGLIYGVTRERIRQLETKVRNALFYRLKNTQCSDLSELKSISTALFLQTKEEPMDAMINFCEKHYGQTIKLVEFIALLAIIIGYFTSHKRAMFEIRIKMKNRLALARKNNLHFVKDKKTHQKWLTVFESTMYPPKPRLFKHKIDNMNTPLREINKNSLGQTGSFFSQKINREVAYESMQEFQIYQIMEHTKKVTWYCEQPISIPYQYNNKVRHYYPDLAVLTSDGHGVIIEVKPIRDMVLEPTLRKALAAIDFLHNKGLGYLMVDSWGRSLKTIGAGIVNKNISQDILIAINNEGNLNYDAYKKVLNGRDFTDTAFISFVAQNDLSYCKNPFGLALLSNDLSFQKLRLCW